MTLRAPRKIKKWHRKRGWVLHFDIYGRAYWTRTYRIPNFQHNWR